MLVTSLARTKVTVQQTLTQNKVVIYMLVSLWLGYCTANTVTEQSRHFTCWCHVFGWVTAQSAQTQNKVVILHVGHVFGWVTAQQALTQNKVVILHVGHVCGLVTCTASTDTEQVIILHVGHVLGWVTAQQALTQNKSSFSHVSHVFGSAQQAVKPTKTSFYVSVLAAALDWLNHRSNASCIDKVMAYNCLTSANKI